MTKTDKQESANSKTTVNISSMPIFDVQESFVLLILRINVGFQWT